MPTQSFRFRPRYGGVAWVAIGLGVTFAILTAVRGGPAAAWGIAGVGAVLGLLYLRSPTWRITVLVDDDGLEVTTAAGQRRFRLPWSEVVKVVASPSTQTCFVDGGHPDRSLLVPGDGAPAPYDIERRGALYRAILDRVARDRVEEVALLEQHRRPAA